MTLSATLRRMLCPILPVIAGVCLGIPALAADSGLNAGGGVDGDGPARGDAKHVLLLLDQSPLLPRNLKIQNGLSRKNREVPGAFVFSTEIPDLGSADENRIQQFDHYLREKYKDHPFDFIISFWAPEAAYARKYRPDIPLINLSGLALNESDQQLDLALNLIDRMAGTVDLAASLGPGPEHCSFISGDLSPDSAPHKAMLQALAVHCARVDILAGGNIQEIKRALSALKEKGWVFFFPFSNDEKGNIVVPREYIGDLTRASASPVFGFHSQMLGQGIVGGEMIDPELLGEAAILALREYGDKGAFLTPFRSTFRGVDETRLDQFYSQPSLPDDVVIVNPIPPLLSRPEINLLLFFSLALVLALLGVGLLLARQSRALSASNEKYRALFETSTVGMALCRLDGTLTEVNQGFMDIVGYSREEVLALTYWQLTPKEYEDREQDQLHSLRTQGRYGPYEKHYICRDGRWVPVILNGALIRDSAGDPFIWSIVQDISERKRSEVALKEKSEALARSNHDLQQFAYVASHDLKEPLRSVSSFLQLLRRKYSAELNEEAQDYIEFAVDGAQRMDRLIQDLLNYARVDSAGHNFVLIDSSQLLQEVLDNLRAQSDGAQAVIRYENLPMVRADRLQMVQLFQNLISNAIHYASSERRPEIDIRAVQFGNQVEFSVSDNGIGIESRYFDQIFVIFQRLHERDKTSGTGVGLAVCKRIVDRHGGRIRVESVPGKGSTFLFTLPAGM